MSHRQPERQPVPGYRRTRWPQNCVAYVQAARCASICACQSNGCSRDGGPNTDNLTMWPTPAATATSISAISLATCRGDVPWARNRRSTPRSALSKVDRASKSTVAGETPDGRRPASDVRVNATISTGSVNSFEIKAEPTRPVAPATAMRVRAALRWEGLNIRITFRILERSVQNTWNDRSMMSSENGMSGKPQFDDDAVINSAMDVFWRHGYSASSIDQLTTAMGLSRSSMYKRFQDKDGLFGEVLSAYVERVERRMSAVRGETKRQQLEALLHEFLPRAGKTARPAGCMLARSCAEMVDLPPAGQSVARQGLTRQRAILGGILREAVASGELAATADIEGLAWHYLGVLQAIMNLPQAGATVGELRRVVELAMLAWPFLPPASQSKPT